MAAESIIAMGGPFTITTAVPVTRFFSGSAVNSAEGSVQIPLRACTIKAMRARVSSNAVYINVIMRKNGVSTALNLEWTAPATGVKTATADVAFVAGDLLSIWYYVEGNATVSGLEFDVQI